MELSLFIFLGALAAISTYVMLRRAVDERIMGAMNTIIWIVWMFGATNLQITTDCCVVTQTRMELALIGFLGAGLSLVFLVGALFDRLPPLSEQRRPGAGPGEF